MSADWAEGYVVDTLYTESFFRELTPSWLNYVGLINGCNVRNLDKPFTYLELGSGMGRSLATIAASFPKGEFIGVDFHPGHVDASQRYIDEAGIGNARFIEASFQDVAAGAHSIPECDFIVLHGIYSWISESARKAIQKIIFDRLKPGGFVYNSYNCHPGWAPDSPMRKLMYEWAMNQPGEHGTKGVAALNFAKEMADAKLGFFQTSPTTGKLIEKFFGRDQNYVAQEFLDANWVIFYSVDLADEMSAGKLTFAGSATLAENHIELVASPEIVKKINEQPTRRMKQLLQDYAVSQRFRRDVFVRGHPRHRQPTITRNMLEMPFALAKANVDVNEAVKVPRGEVRFDQKLYSEIVRALENGVLTGGEIRSELVGRNVNVQDLHRTLMLMAAANIIFPSGRSYNSGAMPKKISRIDLKSKINKVLLKEAVDNTSRCILVSEWGGTGIAIGQVDAIVLSQIATAWEKEDAIVAKLAADYKRRGINIKANPEPATDPTKAPAEATKNNNSGKEEYLPHDVAARDHVTKFVKEQLPLLHRLGIITVS